MPYKNPDDRRAYRKDYYNRNKSTAKKQATDWNKENRERRLEIARKSFRNSRIERYGITQEVLDAIFEMQGWRCASCGVNLRELPSKSICLDHNHRTMRARGVLCKKCNTTLGMLNDDTETVRRLLAYIEHHSKIDK